MLFSGRRYEAGQVVEGAATDRGLRHLLATGMLAAVQDLASVPTGALVEELRQRGFAVATAEEAAPEAAQSEAPEPEPEPVPSRRPPGRPRHAARA